MDCSVLSMRLLSSGSQVFLTTLPKRGSGYFSSPSPSFAQALRRVNHAGNLALPASSAAPLGATSPAGNKRIIPNRRARNQARRFAKSKFTKWKIGQTCFPLIQARQFSWTNRGTRR